MNKLTEQQIENFEMIERSCKRLGEMARMLEKANMRLCAAAAREAARQIKSTSDLQIHLLKNPSEFLAFDHQDASSDIIR